MPVEYWSLDAELAKQTGRRRATARTSSGPALQRVHGKKAELNRPKRQQTIVSTVWTARVYRVADVTKQGDAAPPVGAVHDQHAAAGGLAQARLRRAADDADRAGAVRGRRSRAEGDAGADHLHADRLDERRAVGASRRRGR